MTILTLLKEYEDDVRLKVGAADGNGYYYVGTVGDFRENIIEYNACLETRAIKLAKKSEAALRETIALAPTLQTYVKQALKKSDAFDLDGYMQVVEIWFHDVAAKNKTLQKRQEAVDGYIGITRRNVTDYSMCDSVADDNCLRVLIDGYESGAYWMTSEADTLPSIKFATIAEDEEENEQGINLLIEEDANG